MDRSIVESIVGPIDCFRVYVAYPRRSWTIFRSGTFLGFFATTFRFLSSPRAYLFHQPDLNHVYRQSDPNQDAAPCAVLIGRCFLLAASDRHTDRRQTDQQHGGDDEDERASYSHDINNAAKRPRKTDNAANGLVAVPPTFVVGLDDFHWICFYWCQMAIDTPFILRANIPT